MKSVYAVVLACAACASTPAALAQDGSTWVEQKTTASDGAANSYFGSAAAVHGTTAVIGADGDSSFAGAAYVFAKADGSWGEAQKLTADDASGGAEFGYRIALADAQMVVTAFTANVGANTSQGAAYVFAQGAGSWTQSQKLSADDGASFDNFGSAAAIDGSTLFIGANGAWVGGNASQGAAYVFTSANGTWTQAQKLVSDDGAAYDNFGISLAIVGDTAMIGAPSANIGGNSLQGAVYVYSLSNGQWAQTQKLVASDGGAFASFGMSLAFDGTTAIVGATGADGSGAAYVFTNSGGAWTQAQKLVGADTASGDGFGDAIALSGTQVLIGADIATVDGNTSRGAAYLFGATASGWGQTHKFIASDGTTDDFFGAALALDGDMAVVSTVHPTIDGNPWQGAAYFYTRDTLFADGFDG